MALSDGVDIADMIKNMAIDIMVDGWPFMTAISLVTSFFSYYLKKLGIIFGLICTFLSFFGSVMMMVVGGFAILIVGFLIFPIIIWIGFFLGHHLGKRRTTEIK